MVASTKKYLIYNLKSLKNIQISVFRLRWDKTNFAEKIIRKIRSNGLYSLKDFSPCSFRHMAEQIFGKLTTLSRDIGNYN